MSAQPSQKSEATIRAYRSDWTHFTKWCAGRGLDALPAQPSTVALYLTDLAGVKAAATLNRRITTISRMHQESGFEPPTLSLVVREARRAAQSKSALTRHASPIGIDDLTVMLDGCGARPKDVRDQAILLVGFMQAKRRSEIVALDVADVPMCDADHGEQLCDACAVGRWLAVSGITEGPVFRPVNRHGETLDARLSDRAIDSVVKDRAEVVGLGSRGYRSESLRIGYRASLYEDGEHLDVIADRCRIRLVPPVEVGKRGERQRRRAIVKHGRDAATAREAAQRKALVRSADPTLSHLHEYLRKLSAATSRAMGDAPPAVRALLRDGEQALLQYEVALLDAMAADRRSS